MGIGINSTEFDNIASLAAQHGQFLTRIYTEWDISYRDRKRTKHQHFAARFAITLLLQHSL